MKRMIDRKFICKNNCKWKRQWIPEKSEVEKFQIRKISDQDFIWIEDLLRNYWGSSKIITRGNIHEVKKYPGFIAEKNSGKVGLIIYTIQNGAMEIISLNSLVENLGIGTALIDSVKEEAIASQCRRLWLITTNDNIDAIRFFQIKGFDFAAIHKNAIESSRKLKPEIPLFGNDGIPIKDEIEMEIKL